MIEATKGEWRMVFSVLSPEQDEELRNAGIATKRFLGKRGEVSIHDGDGAPIASVDARSGKHAKDCMERDTNSALMAAGKDLYVALKAIVENGLSTSAMNEAKAALGRVERDIERARGIK